MYFYLPLLAQLLFCVYTLSSSNNGTGGVARTQSSCSNFPDFVGIVGERVGRLTSDRYPEPYSANNQQGWCIEVPRGNDILINWLNVDIPRTTEGTVCGNGNLTVHLLTWNNHVSSILTVCGSGIDWPVIYRSNVVLVVLTIPEGAVVGQGFDLIYKAVPDGVDYPVYEYCGTTSTDPPGYVDMHTSTRGATPPSNRGTIHASISSSNSDEVPIIFIGDEHTERERRIVGGEQNHIEDIPWQVEIAYTHKDGACGGALLQSNWVLTSAWCVDGIDVDDLIVNVQKSSVADDPHQIEMSVIEKIIHPDYNTANSDNNIALLQLTEHVQLNARARVVCLPPPDLTVHGDDRHCVVAGFGTTAGTGSDNVLNSVHLPIIDTDTCNGLDYYFNLITDNMICAGLPDGGVGTCEGDGGSPLTCQFDMAYDNTQSTWMLAGISSWGYSCGQYKKPSVFTNISKYLVWISDNMPPSSQYPEHTVY